jgi:hypothetical protein
LKRLAICLILWSGTSSTRHAIYEQVKVSGLFLFNFFHPTCLRFSPLVLQEHLVKPGFYFGMLPVAILVMTASLVGDTDFTLPTPKKD